MNTRNYNKVFIARLLNLLFSNPVFTRSITTMLLQGLARFLTLLAFILLARLFNTSEYGQLIFGTSMARLASGIIMMGALGIMARAWGRSKLTGFQRNRSIYHIYNWYLYRGLLIATLFILAWFCYEFILKKRADFSIEVIAFLYVIPLFIGNLLQSFFISIKKVSRANVYLVLLNTVWLVLIITAYYFSSFSPKELMWNIIIFTSTLSAIVILVGIKKYGAICARAEGSGELSFALSQWGAIMLAQVDIILLKFFSTTEQIAYYGVALQLSYVLSFVMASINSNIISQLAEDYNTQPIEVYQKKITHYVRIIAFFSIIAVIFLATVGYWICLLYGRAYVTSYFLLLVLMIGQLINLLCGSKGWILNIAGYESITARSFYYVIVINIILGIPLAIYAGAYGVAWASTIALSLWNFILVYHVFKKLGINPTIFAKTTN